MTAEDEYRRIQNESTRLLENKLATHQIEVRRDLTELPAVSVDPSQMKNVFINLLVDLNYSLPG